MNVHLNRGSNLFLLLIGMESLAALLQESFSLFLPQETWLWLGLLCLLLWIAASFRHGALIGMPLCALLLYYLYRTATADPLLELRDLADHITSVYYGYFSNGVPYPFEGAAESHMFALLLIMFLIAAFTAVSLSAGAFRIGLSELATVPLFAACIAINGAPSVQPVLGLLLFWIGLILSGDVFRADDAAGRAMILGLIPSLLLLCALLFFYRPETYEYTQQDIRLSEQFDRVGHLLRNWMGGNNEENGTGTTLSFPDDFGEPESEEEFEATESSVQTPPAGWSSADGALDLTQPFDRSQQDQPVFRLNADQSGSIYLRGRNFGDYTGTGWTAASENSHSSALSYAAQTVFRSASREEHHFRIRSQNTYPLLYLPYYSLTEGSGDLSVSSEGRKNYSGEYYTPLSGAGFAELPDALREEELQYREYVHSYYTRLPDSSRIALLQICEQNGLRADRSDILTALATYVRSVGVYDTSTDPYPDSDYAVYFLTVARRGYCIHFATAAAALYRSLGIPARVCEGYLVSAEQGRSVPVTGANAHAWVEVYVDGIGWIPVEVTASESAELETQDPYAAPPEESSPDPQENGYEPDSSGQEPAPQEAVPQEDPGGQEAPSGNGIPDNVIGSSESVADQSGLPGASGTSSLPHRFRVLLKSILALCVLAGLFFGRYAILRAGLAKRLQVPDSRKRAVNYYRQAERLSRFGLRMPDNIREIAEKASFSRHEIGQEELADSAETLRRETETLYASLRPWKKFLFRFWYANR